MVILHQMLSGAHILDAVESYFKSCSLVFSTHPAGHAIVSFSMVHATSLTA